MLLLAQIIITAGIKARRSPTPAWVRGIQTVCREGGSWWRAVPDQQNGGINLYCGPDPANMEFVERISVDSVAGYVSRLLSGDAVEAEASPATPLDVTEAEEPEPNEEIPVVLDRSFFEKMPEADEVDVASAAGSETE